MGYFVTIVAIGIAAFALLVLIGIIYYIFIEPPVKGIDVAGRGPLLNSTVSFYILRDDGSNGDLIGKTTSDPDGIYRASVRAEPGTHVIAEASGGHYQDYSSRARALKQGQRLTAVTGIYENSWIAITPLTHMAAARASELMLNGTLNRTAVDSSNAGIALQYGIGDIVWSIVVPADDGGWINELDFEQRDYSLVLAGISEEAATLNVDTIELANALAQDASDGILDGKDDGENIMMDTLSGGSARLDPDAGLGGVQDGIGDASVAPNLQDRKANFGIPLVPVPIGINGAGKFYVTSSMLPAAIELQPYSFQLTAEGGTGPYACTGRDLPSWLELFNNCTLNGTAPMFISGTTMTISPPFEITMCDSAGSCTTFQARITVVGKKPEIIIEDYILCYVDEKCDALVATATGGIKPYYYRSDYLRYGATPFGTVVGTNGHLIGIPTQVGDTAFGICVIDLIGAYSCGQAFVSIIPRNATLYITKTGDGTGKVYADPYREDGIYDYGEEVVLTAEANPGSTFKGWRGDCYGVASKECQLTMDSGKEVEAIFDSNAPEPGGMEVKITSGNCQVIKGEAYGPVGTKLAVYHLGGAPAYSINCGKWSRGPETQYQCYRGSNDPQGTGWAAEVRGGRIDATVYADTENYDVFGGGDIMKTDSVTCS